VFGALGAESHAEVVSVIHTTCPVCSATVCPACLSESCPVDCNFLIGTCIAFNHCKTSRVFSILQILSALDQFRIKHKTEPAKPRAVALKNKRKASDNGTGYGYGYSYGGGPSTLESAPPYSSQSTDSVRVEDTKHLEAGSAYDAQLLLIFDSLAHLLPAPSNTYAAEFDYLPHPSLGAIIRSSYLLEVFEELLRNDSVEDMSLRSGLYFSMMKILRLFAGHEALFNLLTQKREIISKTEGVHYYIRNGGTPEKLAEPVPKPEKVDGRTRLATMLNSNKAHPSAENKETAKLQYGPPLLNLFEKLVTQARIFRKTAASNYQSLQFDDDGEMSTKAVGLCGDLVELWDVITLSIQDLENSRKPDQGEPSTPKGKQPETKVDLPEYLKKLAYAEYDILGADNKLHPFAYTREVESLGSQSLNPKRTLTLAKELATMSTSLPEGIFVRVQLDRPVCSPNRDNRRMS
jgi:hypothetical protein